MSSQKKTILLILDGWGLGDGSRADAISQAETPNWDRLWSSYPHSSLQASGEAVGLPAGVMGNSEVGHLNIGAGRVVYQDLARINQACTDDSLASNPQLQEAFSLAKQAGRRLHFLGLLSDGGVHAMNTHLYYLCQAASRAGVKDVFVHALGDGRDTDPHSGLGFVREAEKELAKSGAILATMIGRYYTMDRDQRWERVKRGYDLLLKGEGKKVTDFPLAIEESYVAGVGDEFLEPLVKVDASGQPLGLVRPDDVFICFNYRTERLREISIALTQKNLPEHGLSKIPLYYYTLTKYDESFKDVKVILDKEKLRDTLGEVVSRNGLKQLRIAETEKYAHVTFFFSGGREEPFSNESRALIPSPHVATYDLQPEMSVFKITEALLAEIKKKSPDFICANFANGDMVGHTGVYEAILKAVSSVDVCLGDLSAAALQEGYNLLIIADHGNAEKALNPDGSSNTAHTTNPVPCLLISQTPEFSLADGSLADVAPTILSLLDLKKPTAMTGQSLLR